MKKVTRQNLAEEARRLNDPWRNKKNIHEEKKSFKNPFKNAFKKAKDFFKHEYKDVKKNAKKILKDLAKRFSQSKKPENFKPGKMLAFQYKAKYDKQKYDKSPLIICLGPPKDKKMSHTHTYGLNIHWMPVKQRVAVSSFFVELLEKREGELVWDDVKPFLAKFKGNQVLRMYIIKNISSKVIEMPSDIYLRAAAVPSEQWVN